MRAVRARSQRWVATVVAVAALALGCASGAAAAPDPRRYVDPLIGTGGLGTFAAGHTFPGAARPFGMVQFSPESSPDGGPGGYSYEAKRIRGFALTRLSGTGCANYGHFPIMPVLAPPSRYDVESPATHAATFSHARERAEAGSYRVRLDTGIRVQLTATVRTGFGSFTFPAGRSSTILIDAGGSANGRSMVDVSVSGPDEVRGSQRSDGFCGGPVHPTVHFVARFDRPFASSATWGQDGRLEDVRARRTLNAAGAALTFDTRARPTVQVRIGISFVSQENAARNLAAEASGRTFADTERDAQRAWSARLRRIQVRGGTETDKRIFYTALYHSLLHPNVFSDVNGEYLGRDDRVHVAQGRAQYTNFAGWDVYRSQIPLLALLAPEPTSDMMQSLVVGAEEGGSLSKWLLGSWESGVMIGDSADPVLAGAYAFGARRFDTRKALDAMVRGATRIQSGPFAYPSQNAEGYVQRPGLREYLSLGYVPLDHGQGFIWGPSATTLEYATDDFAISRLALGLGLRETARTFLGRAQSWRQVFNPATRLVEPRRSDGTFWPAHDPTSEVGFAEGNAWQYSWMVPHDVGSLMAAMGGRDQAAARLDRFFQKLNVGISQPHAWMGNQPSFVAPWLYAWAGRPWRTQAVVRRISSQLFRATPNGLPGDDDLGAMSSWYVWSALGMYPAIPGVGGFVLSTPRFPEATVQLGGGERLRLVAPRASARYPYVRSLRLGGRPYGRPWLPLASIADGAVLEFGLGRRPSRSWGSEASSAPPSFGSAAGGAAVPARNQ